MKRRVAGCYAARDAVAAIGLVEDCHKEFLGAHIDTESYEGWKRFLLGLRTRDFGACGPSFPTTTRASSGQSRRRSAVAAGRAVRPVCSGLSGATA